MMYFSAFLWALGLFMLVVVWSLIEICVESRKARNFASYSRRKFKLF
ncbi:hypothetical protein [Acinetobacter sp. ANC 4470]|nr:hypothetical protein [Acinetobacter sp. ANC 4470]